MQATLKLSLRRKDIPEAALSIQISKHSPTPGVPYSDRSTVVPANAGTI